MVWFPLPPSLYSRENRDRCLSFSSYIVALCPLGGSGLGVVETSLKLRPPRGTQKNFVAEVGPADT